MKLMVDVLCRQHQYEKLYRTCELILTVTAGLHAQGNLLNEGHLKDRCPLHRDILCLEAMLHANYH